jgi:hypothetical protein
MRGEEAAAEAAVADTAASRTNSKSAGRFTAVSRVEMTAPVNRSPGHAVYRARESSPATVCGHRVKPSRAIADSKVERRDDLLDAYREKLAKLERAKGQIEADMLARQQRELARQVQTVMDYISQLARSQSAVTRELSKP